MSGKNRQNQKAGFGKSLRIAALAVAALAISAILYLIKDPAQEMPEELLVRYMSYIEKQEYEEI